MQQIIRASLQRRKLLLTGSYLFSPIANACAFGESLIKQPLVHAPGKSGFRDIRDFLVKAHPKLLGTSIEYSKLLNIIIKPLAENTSRRSLAINYKGIAPQTTESMKLIVILQYDIQIVTTLEKIAYQTNFEEVASFDFRKGSLPYITTRIRSHNSGTILHAALIINTKNNQYFLLNQSLTLYGIPCFKYQYY